MSVALYIVPEREIEGFDHFVDGKSIGHESDRAVDRVCKAAGVRSLYEFCSQDPGELAEFIEAEGGEAPEDLPARQWFAAADGLAVVRAMLERLERSDALFDDPQGVAEDLKRFEALLGRLEAEGIRWHLAVDF